MTQLNTPVLFLVFNRVETTREVLAAIRKAKPRQLFIAADGPRAHKEGEKARCDQVRDLVLNSIDWKCDVKTLFREENLGCKKAVSSAITWFFENVEQGIILEDDCLPDQSFFGFCQNLLEKYKHDERVMIISGDNKNIDTSTIKTSYFFSQFPHIWGWATWRRAWSQYEIDMKSYPRFKKEKQIENLFFDKSIQKFWADNFELGYGGTIDTWDYQWTYKIISNASLVVMPAVNLVSNIGFGENATHTTINDNRQSALRTETLDLNKLVHPQFVIPNRYLDSLIGRKAYGVQDILPQKGSKVRGMFRRVIPLRLRSLTKRLYFHLAPR